MTAPEVVRGGTDRALLEESTPLLLSAGTLLLVLSSSVLIRRRCSYSLENKYYYTRGLKCSMFFLLLLYKRLKVFRISFIIIIIIQEA